MYWRYFMWNFAGKQNDVQGITMGNVRDGNWKTGIGFYDKMRLGDQGCFTDSLKNNKANNKLFPQILGLLGLFYQYKKDKKDAPSPGCCFSSQAFAICCYLNQAGNQPRERDYAYVGSFYAFAIWIGLGVLFVKDLFQQGSKRKNSRTCCRYHLPPAGAGLNGQPGMGRSRQEPQRYWRVTWQRLPGKLRKCDTHLFWR